MRPVLEAWKSATLRHFEASLGTIEICVERCPESLWSAPLHRLLFGQVAFHAVFYADYYLGADERAFRTQEFHRVHAAQFGDYEELEDREPVSLHSNGFVRLFLEHCYAAAARAIADESADSLCGHCGFAGRPLTRAELYLYNIRHVQHHAAQLSSALRSQTGAGAPWVGFGRPQL